ncbi:MAG: hypothetical protein ACD_75C00517G0001 [uncultured bacterium]|nr:MAG: hypothetical protein ACD_75C00517G0001 [uncultured bacterium]
MDCVIPVNCIDGISFDRGLKIILQVDDENNKGSGGGRDAHRFGHETDRRHLGDNQRKGLGSTGSGQNDIVLDGTILPQVGYPGLRQPVEDLLAAGRCMNGHHGSTEDFIRTNLLQQRLDHVRETGRRTGGGRNHRMTSGIVHLLIDTHHSGDCIPGHIQALRLDLERGGEDDFFCPRLHMPSEGTLLRIGVGGRIGENAGGVDHQLHPVVLPGYILGIPGRAQNFNRHSIDHHGPFFIIQFFNDPRTFMAMQICAKTSIGGILLQHHRQVFQTSPDLPTNIGDDS